jgi:hypothetical protein
LKVDISEYACLGCAGEPVGRNDLIADGGQGTRILFAQELPRCARASATPCSECRARHGAGSHELPPCENGGLPARSHLRPLLRRVRHASGCVPASDAWLYAALFSAHARPWRESLSVTSVTTTGLHGLERTVGPDSPWTHRCGRADQALCLFREKDRGIVYSSNPETTAPRSRWATPQSWDFWANGRCGPSLSDNPRAWRRRCSAQRTGGCGRRAGTSLTAPGP